MDLSIGAVVTDLEKTCFEASSGFELPAPIPEAQGRTRASDAVTAGPLGTLFISVELETAVEQSSRKGNFRRLH